MHYRTERQETIRQNNSRFEEAYFQTPFDVTNYNINDQQYTYEIPQQFATNPSQEKTIGLRRVKLTPMMANFNLAVIYDSNAVTSNLMDYEVQPENTLQEIIHTIYDDTKSDPYLLFFEFDGYNLEITARNSNTNRNVPFAFAFRNASRDEANVLWQLFNQTGDPFPDMLTFDNTGTISQTYEVDSIYMANVWSRKELYVHASFSNAHNRFLCLSDDFYEDVDKYYEDNTHRSNFSLYFTTNGTQKITPYSAQILIELRYKIRR